MAYRFKLGERVDQEFKRVAASQLAQAISEIEEAETSAGGVHKARKSLKRLRALLRLVEPAIGAKARKRHNVALRDVGRMLAGERDRVVVDEVIANVRAQVVQPGSHGHGAAEGAPASHQATGPLANLGGILSPATAAAARGELAAAGEKLAKVTFKTSRFTAVAAGLKQSYLDARQTLRAVMQDPADERLHDLRKAVQWHWRQMHVLSRAWPEYFEMRAEAARELSQVLGDSLDIALAMHSPAFDQAPDRDVLRPILQARRDVLQQEAVICAQRIFSEKPGAFAGRVERYWKLASSRRTAKSQVAEDGGKSRRRASREVPVFATSAPRLAVKTPRAPPSRKAG